MTLSPLINRRHLCLPPTVVTYTYIHDTHIIISIWSPRSILPLLRTRSRVAVNSHIIHIDERKPRSEGSISADEVQSKYRQTCRCNSDAQHSRAYHRRSRRRIRIGQGVRRSLFRYHLRHSYVAYSCAV